MSDEPVAPRFVADHMLGSLARWLRIMGYDTVYDKKMADAEIVALARREDRFVLTRDKELAREPGSYFVEADDLDAQLTAIVQKYGLRMNDDLVRCSLCNGDLVGLPKEEAKDNVPEGAFVSNDRFWKCARCGKIYWKGTHWRGIMERFRRLSLA